MLAELSTQCCLQQLGVVQLGGCSATSLLRAHPAAMGMLRFLILPWPPVAPECLAGLRSCWLTQLGKTCWVRRSAQASGVTIGLPSSSFRRENPSALLLP